MKDWTILDSLKNDNREKLCKKCGIEKSLSEFHNDKSTKDGKTYQCKKCRNSASVEWEKNNPKRYAKNMREWRKKNPERSAELCKNYYNRNKEACRLRSKLYGQLNKIERAQYFKEWKSQNRDICNKLNKKYSSTLKGKINHSMSTLIRRHLKDNKGGRSWTTLVPYTLDQLIKHLKKTLSSEYTWQDYLNGKLHIDHKVPISVFNYSRSEHIDFKQCWALSNLQLLPIKKNLIKGAKLNKPFQPSLAFGI